MKRILLLLLVLFAACNASRDKIPSDIIPKDKMIPIRHYFSHTANAPIENTTLTLAHSPQIAKKTPQHVEVGLAGKG